MRRYLLTYTFSVLFLLPASAGGGEGTSCPSALAKVETRADDGLLKYVNPFIGTTNFGTTNPGAVCPNGLMSVVPFNVMGSGDNKYDKDARWWSTPYEYHNCFFTGFSHVNLSGVGCPELGSLLLMPTTGELSVDYKEYGSRYQDEQASPGYYSNYLTRYGVKTEVSATPRTGATRFTFPAGESHILLNLGEGLTNESGAFLRQVSDCEFEGMKLLGTFCYNPQAVFPIYFVMRVNKAPEKSGYWKKQRPMIGVEAEWDPDNGKYKLYTQYRKELAGDDIGIFLTYQTEANEQIEVQLGVSFVSMENARLNLNAEQKGKDFDQVLAEARARWTDDLSRIRVEGGTEEQKTVFYTALYHLLIHPNILQDVNGEYPAMESDRILTTQGNRYTVYSLWDTYRNVHQLLTLVYPERQLQMVRTMIDMYREHGWLPKWELYGRETLTMEGDPAISVLTDTWLKGLRDFDIQLAYEAMYKSATLPGKENLLRPDNDDYMKLGYVPLREKYDNSVSHALEYYIADHSLSLLADALAKEAQAKGEKTEAEKYRKDARLFRERSLGYKHYYSKEYGTFRPLLPDGQFYAPFNPRQGENFEPNPGFHEGSAWNYTFYVPHDVKGLARLMGGRKAFVSKLQSVFDEGLYDPANEPDIAYAHLFSYFEGEEWRTQKELTRLMGQYFKNAPDGIPGNEDTGTMSAWVIFNMLGFYPDCPGEPAYTLSTPVFDRAEIKLDAAVWGKDKLVIETERPSKESVYIRRMELGDKKLTRYRIGHDELVKAGRLKFILK
ncbi:MAG: GH92 family glycosyl hydrolase [Bacteroides sp.]|nr:GH92 family glycosyl hydrolase [Bacteroides sp.]